MDLSDCAKNLFSSRYRLRATDSGQQSKGSGLTPRSMVSPGAAPYQAHARGKGCASHHYGEGDGMDLFNPAILLFDGAMGSAPLGRVLINPAWSARFAECPLRPES